MSYRHRAGVCLAVVSVCQATRRRQCRLGCDCEVVQAALRGTQPVCEAGAVDGYLTRGAGGIFTVQHAVPARARHVEELEEVAEVRRRVHMCRVVGNRTLAWY